MTEQQATDLHLFLNTGLDGHVSELSVGESYGKVTADAVGEVIRDLRAALEDR